MTQPNTNPFSGQGDKLRPVEDNDKYVLAQSASGVGAGFRTVNADAHVLVTTVTNDIKTKGIGTLINIDYESGGLIGVGTVDDPLRVDPDWVNANYSIAPFSNISQIGDIRESNLPISGSYFSIGYPSDSMNRNFAYFDEGVYIVPVTNGSEIRYVVGKPDAHSDQVYEPPLPPGTVTYDDYYIDNILSKTGKWILAWLRKKNAAHQDISQDKLLVIDTDNTPYSSMHNVKLLELSEFLHDSEEYVSGTFATAGRSVYQVLSKFGAFICEHGSNLYAVRYDVASTIYSINPRSSEVGLKVMRLSLEGDSYVRTLGYGVSTSQWVTEYGLDNPYVGSSNDINVAGLLPRLVSEVGHPDDPYTPIEVNVGIDTTLNISNIPGAETYKNFNSMFFTILTTANTFYIRLHLTLLLSQTPTATGMVNSRSVSVVQDYLIDFNNRKFVHIPNGAGDFVYNTHLTNGMTFTEPYAMDTFVNVRQEYVGRKRLRFQSITNKSSMLESEWDIATPVSWVGPGYQQTMLSNKVYNTYSPSPTVIELGATIVPLTSTNTHQANYLGFRDNSTDFGWLLIKATDSPTETLYGMNSSGVVSAFSGYSLGLDRSDERYPQSLTGYRVAAYTFKNSNTVKCYSTSSDYRFNDSSELLPTVVYERRLHGISGWQALETTLNLNALISWLNTRHPNAIKFCGRVIPYEATTGWRMYVEVSAVNPSGGSDSETIVIDTTCVKSGNSYTIDPIDINSFRVIVSVSSTGATKVSTSPTQLTIYTDTTSTVAFSNTMGIVTNNASLQYQNRICKRIFSGEQKWYISAATTGNNVVYDRSLGLCMTSKIWLDIAYSLRQITLSEVEGTEVLNQTISNQHYILATPYTTGMYMVKVTADIPLFFNTKNDVLKPLDIDLETLFDSVENKTFYMYLTSGVNGAEIEVVDLARAERIDSTLIATIITDSTKITSIKAIPFIRLDRYRISTIPIGSAIPVSSGNPGETNFTLWE